jgi:hypothetical protein
LTGATGATGPAGTPGGGTNRVYRWNVFGTYDNGGFGAWFLGNDTALFGGVQPSNWTDANATASNLSSNKDVLRALFTNKGYPGKNALVYAETYTQFSSTTSRMVVSLFRVQNTTVSPINWTVRFAYTCYGGWSEIASAALNGVSVMTANTTCAAGGQQTDIVLSIPENRVSTVIFVSASNQGVSTGSVVARAVLHGFTNNSLDLPAGLQFVDDLETATGGWEQ